MIRNRRAFLKAAGRGIGGTAFRSLQAAVRPNIVYILADDLGWGDPGCYNPASKIPTPNLDRLAAQGMRFTDMHSPSAVCTPTRYGILTGRYCWRSSLKQGVLQGYSPNLVEPGRTTVASLLKRAGYYTAGVGKWHLGLGDRPKTDYDQPLRPGPNEHGFDYYFGIPASLDMPPYLFFENGKPVEKPTAHTPGGGSKRPIGAFWREGAIAPGLKIEDVLPALTRKSVELVRSRAVKREQPFFLYFAMTGPHTPWVPTEPFRERSTAGEYGDFVAQCDDAAGQVIWAIEEAGAADNTLVVFTSDNGGYWPRDMIEKFSHRSNANWRGMKADIWDGGHRIPFIVRWPGHVRAGARSSQLGCLTDLMATAADLNGIALPENAGEDSFSLLPALTGRGGAVREAVVHHSAQGMFSIRERRWKLVLGRGSGGFSEPRRIVLKPGEPEGELYDLRNDPSEMANLYLKYPEVVRRLTSLLEKYQREGRSRAV